MTVANDIISLSLRTSGVTGVGQVPLTQDTQDAFTVLNALIGEWNLERATAVNRVPIPVFPDLTTDVPFWNNFNHVLILSLPVRLRQIYSLPPVELDVKLAAQAIQIFQSINLEQISAPSIAANDGTGYGIIYLALRAAGRVADNQGVLQSSQDVSDALSLVNEMLGEWNRERAVKVIPGALPTISDPSVPITLSAGQRNAIVLNLAVRLRDWFGAEPSKTLDDRAERALALIQAINLQQNPAPTIAGNDGTGYGIVYLALRAAGRVADDQGVLQTSQDVTDAVSLMNEMLDEWNREREVKVIPGALPVISNPAAPINMLFGHRNAIVLNLGVRLREWFGAEPSKSLNDRADRALALVQAINLQQQGAPTIAQDDGTGYGIIFLALRAAGRVADDQGVSQSSQDVTDAASLLREMLDEWNQQRVVRVIPGEILGIPDLSLPLTLATGMRSAIVLNLAIRLRDWFGSEVSKSLADRAAQALELVQAINQQQFYPPHAGVPETVIQVIFLALRLAGRINDNQYVSDSSKDVADAFSLLVMMLAQWQRKRWLVWNEQEVSVVATGADFYTIGPGQDIDTARPDKIHAAWVRLLHSGSASGSGQIMGGSPLAAMLPFTLGDTGVPAGTTTPAPYNQVDIPLAIIEAKEDWSKIAIKDLKSLPTAVFYDSSFPVGRVYFWPVPPDPLYEMHLIVKASLPVYVTHNDPLNLPPEYVDAVVNNLAVRIAVASPGAPVNPLLLAEARASLNTIRLTNSQIPLLVMPAALMGRRAGDMSSWSGRGLDQAWTVGGTSVLG